MRGKGRTQTTPITLPTPAQAALQVWIAERGNFPRPLFTNFDRARKGSGRLTGAAIYQLVGGFGVEVGATGWPHGLRHLAITRALNLFNGDVRKVARFPRHRTALRRHNNVMLACRQSSTRRPAAICYPKARRYVSAFAFSLLLDHRARSVRHRCQLTHLQLISGRT